MLLRYLNNNFNKIIAINGKDFYYVNVDEDSIRRKFTTLESIIGWKKITSEQFDSMLSAVLKDLQDSDLEDKEESNWGIVYNSIVNSINKEK